jgi:hypothetical protein
MLSDDESSVASRTIVLNDTILGIVMLNVIMPSIMATIIELYQMKILHTKGHSSGASL